MQHHEMLLHKSLKVKHANFDFIASQLASVSPEVVKVFLNALQMVNPLFQKNAEERQVNNLLKQVNGVAASVPGSSAGRGAMPNEILGLMIEKGLSSFYITINPADVFNPVVKFLAGSEIDIDKLLPEEICNYWNQSVLIAKNPVVMLSLATCVIKDQKTERRTVKHWIRLFLKFRNPSFITP
ncbi:hypothetical protein B0H19DRAFT_1215155 [Mycena capillaripes]|nr:hypothetical protein B0H19DRAFT_1215155 [Mycena capillaripes]